jgi:hypothetical protein
VAIIIRAPAEVPDTDFQVRLDARYLCPVNTSSTLSDGQARTASGSEVSLYGKAVHLPAPVYQTCAFDVGIPALPGLVQLVV